jgi:hypothetical protein
MVDSLPPKPSAVAHVTDAHWRAALEAASKKTDFNGFTHLFGSYSLDHSTCKSVIDNARCLILLGEVPKPVEDRIDAAIANAYRDYWNRPFSSIQPSIAFRACCRKHFAGLTFPPME